MIATGFLRSGPNRGGGERGRQDALDDLVATTSLTFLGMTVGCARCHNHKFDPIPQKDYYRIQAVFFSTAAGRVSARPGARGRARTTRRDAAHRRAAASRCGRRRQTLEAPYLKRLVDAEIAQAARVLQVAWQHAGGRAHRGAAAERRADREDAAERHAARRRSPRRTSSR